MVLVAGIGLLVGPQRPEAGLPTATARPSTTAAAPLEHATSIDDFSRMCENGKPFTGAPAYQGDAPHPVVRFFDDQLEAADAKDGTPPDSKHLVKADTVQLVACVQRDEKGPEAQLRTCDYDKGYSAILYQVHWQVGVYEARTGRQIMSMTLDSDPDADCPPVMEFFDNKTTTGYFNPPIDAQYAPVYSLVTGPVHR